MANAEPIDQRAHAKLDILIVGAGVAGLLLALECKRLGFSPIVLERRSSIEVAGDFVVIGDSAVQVFEHWPQLKACYEEQSHKVEAYYHRHTGEHVLGPVPLKKSTGRPLLRCNLVKMLEEAALRQQIPILFRRKIIAYFEDQGLGGVKLASGERMTADVVVACDGIHSASWNVITAKKPTTMSSGSAIYRTSVSADYIFRKEPSLQKQFALRDGKPYLKWFSGPGTHGIVFSDGETICWSIQHPENENTSTESWSATIDGNDAAEQMLQGNPDWSLDVISLARNTPQETVNDWLLLFRDPEPTWVSHEGHVVQCGDSAHPFLPTSANGATQAMEDASTLATALRLGVEAGCSTKESLSIYNILRFERTSCAQLMGVYIRQMHHETNWDEVSKSPSILTDAGPGKWIADHIPETYAIENFDECLKCLRNRKAFKNTNTPPGFTYRPWTCAEILRRQAQKDPLHLEGNWM